MGLDSALYWFGKMSEDGVKRLGGKNVRDCNAFYTDEIDSPQYKYIKHKLSPVEMYETSIDYDKIMDKLGIPEDERCIYSISPTRLSIGKDYDSQKEYFVNIYDKQYEKTELKTFWVADMVREVEWRKHYFIKDLFDDYYPEVWDEYDKKYEQIYGAFLPITDEIKDDLLKEYPDLADIFSGGTENYFMESDW